MAHEFLTQFAFSADIDVSRRELEATRQRPDESISSFVNRWRPKVVGMIDQPKEQDQIDMVLRNLQSRFARRLVGIPFQDLKSLVHAAFSVEEAIAQGLWTNTAPSHDSKGKKLVGSSTISGGVGAISYQHQRPTHHSSYRPLQSGLIYFIHSISINRFMFSNLTLLRLASNHDHHIREPLLTRHLDHMHRGPRDNSLHWT